MKSNVDLTIDNKFSRNRLNGFGNFFRTSLIQATSSIKYPWVINTTKSIRHSTVNGSIVLTGNKLERKMARREQEYKDEILCECCGIKFNKKPWIKGQYSLCSNCDYMLNNRIEKSYWQQEHYTKRKVGTKSKLETLSLEQVIERLQ